MPARSAITLTATLWLLAMASACTGDDAADVPTEVTAKSSGPEATPVATAAPPVALTPGTPSPESLDAALAALIGSMRGGGVDPFGGPPESLPPELRALLEALGIDLLLGTALTEIGGVLVVEAVFAGSPAERAGVLVGDVVTAIDGTQIDETAELRSAVEAVAPGDTYALTVRGGGTTRVVHVERADAEDSFWRSDMLRTLALGLMLANRPGGIALPPSLLGELLEETPDGLRVFAVFPGSPADAAGLRAGDYVLAIEGHPMRTLEDLAALMTTLNPIAGETEVTLRRNGEEVTVRVPFRIGGLFGAGTPIPAE
ncbi:MAG: PDZ domain-containing protein [Chloroflexi bacterium]|nr:PDZ domain-containing protein [Chloroflexota bacterium]